MRRIIGIVGGLLIGLAGLFMSVCGGGLLGSIAYQGFRNRFGPNTNGFLGVWIFPAGFLALGIFLCWTAYRIIRDRFKGD